MAHFGCFLVCFFLVVFGLCSNGEETGHDDDDRFSSVNGAVGTGCNFGGDLINQLTRTFSSNTGRVVRFLEEETDEEGSDINLFSNSSVDFFLVEDVRELDPEETISVPFALTAVVPVFNLPELHHDTLFMDGPTLSHIFSGKIRSWNDSEILQLNPHLAGKLPQKEIIRITLGEENGLNFVFSQALHLLDEQGNWTIGKDLHFPHLPNAITSGEEGYHYLVNSIPYSVSYTVLFWANELDMQQMSMKNKHGTFVKATTSSLASSANAWITNHSHSVINGYVGSLINMAGEESWPLCGHSYIAISKRHSLNNAFDITLNFIFWILLSDEAEHLAMQSSDLRISIQFSMKAIPQFASLVSGESRVSQSRMLVRGFGDQSSLDLFTRYSGHHFDEDSSNSVVVYQPYDTLREAADFVVTVQPKEFNPTEFLAFPVVASGLIPIYNLVSELNGTSIPIPITLRSQDIVGILRGTITNWNHPTLVEANAGIPLPPLNISLFVFQEGTNYAKLLQRLITHWTFENITEWSNVSIQVGGLEPVSLLAQQVKSIPGALGFCPFSYASGHQKAMLVNNDNPNPIQVSYDSIFYAIDDMWSESPQIGDFLYSGLDTSSLSWPLSYLLFLVIERDSQAQSNCDVKRALLDFVGDIFQSSVMFDVASEEGYAPLPIWVRSLVFQELSTVRCAHTSLKFPSRFFGEGISSLDKFLRSMNEYYREYIRDTVVIYEHSETPEIREEYMRMGFLDFDLSDASDTPENPGLDVLTFPAFYYGFGLGHNIPSFHSDDLVLSREAVTGIFNGTINYWDNPIILRDNPKHTSFLHEKISIVHVMGEHCNNDHLFLTRALSEFSAEWNNTYGISELMPMIPTNTYIATTEENFEATIQANPFSIGIGSFLITGSTRLVKMWDSEDGDGNQIFYDAQSIAASKGIVNAQCPNCWPFASSLNLRISRNLNTPRLSTCKEATELVEFLGWWTSNSLATETIRNVHGIVCTDSQEYLQELGKIQCDGKPAVESYYNLNCPTNEEGIVCGHGQCANTLDHFFCSCESGWVGDACDLEEIPERLGGYWNKIKVGTITTSSVSTISSILVICLLLYRKFRGLGFTHIDKLTLCIALSNMESLIWLLESVHIEDETYFLCNFVASLKHFFILSTFAWTACIAWSRWIIYTNPMRDLEGKLDFYFFSRYIPISSILPLVITSLILSLGGFGYGEFGCWLRDSRDNDEYQYLPQIFVIFGFFVPYFVVGIIHSATFVFVFRITRTALHQKWNIAMWHGTLLILVHYCTWTWGVIDLFLNYILGHPGYFIIDFFFGTAAMLSGFGNLIAYLTLRKPWSRTFWTSSESHSTKKKSFTSRRAPFQTIHSRKEDNADTDIALDITLDCPE